MDYELIMYQATEIMTTSLAVSMPISKEIGPRLALRGCATLLERDSSQPTVFSLTRDTITEYLKKKSDGAA